MKRTKASPRHRPPARPTRRVTAGNAEVQHWQPRLVQRKYLEWLRPELGTHFSARVAVEGASAYYLLGSAEEDKAAARAAEIQRLVATRGWDAAARLFPREFTLAVFWDHNPLLCTYATLVTEPAQPARMPRSQPGSALALSARIAILESDESVLHAMMDWADRLPGCRCAAAFTDAKDAASACRALDTDILLYNRALLDPLAARALGPQGPPVALAFGVYETSDDIFISHTGVSHGYYLLRRRPEQALDPLTAVLREGPVQSEHFPHQVRRFFQQLIGAPELRGSLREKSALTPREDEILLRLSKGYPDKQIAQTLNISTWTVHNHMKNIFKKLDVHTRTQAVIKYLQR